MCAVAKTAKGKLKEYEHMIVMNFNLRSKKRLGIDEELADNLFRNVAQRFPDMNDALLPEQKEQKEGSKGDFEYVLGARSEEDIERPLRAIRLSQDRVSLGAGFPLSLGEQMDTLLGIAEVVDACGIVSMLMLDFAYFTIGFEFTYAGNHHQRILEVLFNGSCFARIGSCVGGKATLFSPEIYFACSEDETLRFIPEIRGRTSVQEIESGDYDEDEISAICSVMKVRSFAADETIVSLCKKLSDECVKIAEEAYIDSVVVPLIAGTTSNG